MSHLQIPYTSPQLGVRLFWLGARLAQLVPPAVNSLVLVISAAALGLLKANSVKDGEGTVCLIFKQQFYFLATLNIYNSAYILGIHSVTQ